MQEEEKTSSNRVRRVSAKERRAVHECLPKPNDIEELHGKWDVHCYEKSEPEPGRGHLCRQKRFMECQGWSELRRASMVAKEILQRIIQGYLVHPLYISLQTILHKYSAI